MHFVIESAGFTFVEATVSGGVEREVREASVEYLCRLVLGYGPLRQALIESAAFSE